MYAFAGAVFGANLAPPNCREQVFCVKGFSVMKSIRRACSSRVHAMRDEDEAAGFTLVELLVVVAIIAILAAIAIPIYLSVQSNARDSAVKSGLQTAQTKIAATTADGSTPTSDTVKAAANAATTATTDKPGVIISCTTPTEEDDSAVLCNGSWGTGTTVGDDNAFSITQGGKISATSKS